MGSVHWDSRVLVPKIKTTLHMLLSSFRTEGFLFLTVGTKNQRGLKCKLLFTFSAVSLSDFSDNLVYH